MTGSFLFLTNHFPFVCTYYCQSAKQNVVKTLFLLLVNLDISKDADALDKSDHYFFFKFALEKSLFPCKFVVPLYTFQSSIG